MNAATQKEFKHYSELVELLIARGMVISDRARASRKLARVTDVRIMSEFGINPF